MYKRDDICTPQCASMQVFHSRHTSSHSSPCQETRFVCESGGRACPQPGSGQSCTDMRAAPHSRVPLHPVELQMCIRDGEMASFMWKLFIYCGKIYMFSV